MFCKTNVSIVVGGQRNRFLYQSIALTAERLLERKTILAKMSILMAVANMLMRRK
jgi:hypothetical protein